MKDAYYFPHDSNARNDQKILKLRFKHGSRGYGIYFMLIEIMRDNKDYSIKENDLEMISVMDIKEEYKVVKDVVYNYDLFMVQGGFIMSNSFNHRMEKVETLRNIRSEAGRKGGKVKAKAKQKPSKSESLNKIKSNKIKKTKSITDRCVEFDTEVKKYVSNHPDKYAPKLVDSFISYWSEYSKGGKKMRWEDDEPFGIGKRLGTFKKNDYEGYQKEFEDEIRIKKEQEERRKMREREDVEYASPEDVKELFDKFGKIGKRIN